MRRWNGWGDTAVTYPLPASALQYLEQKVGPGTPPQDATFEEVVSAVPSSRLPVHPLVSSDPEERLRHAHGQSLPDWIALRSGRISVFPDGIAYPTTGDEIRELIRYAGDVGAKLIPYGGGTSVCGHINPLPGEMPVLTVDMRRMGRILHFDVTDHLATFGAGIAGPELEAQLRARGFTLGHFPQSFELSTLGGWVSTRSCGQQSLRYGRMEDLFAGARLEAPAGTVIVPFFPASAAGPDLGGLILGSEGRLGILTEVTVRIRPLQQREVFHVVFFPDFERGQDAVRQILQAGLPLSLLRLSTDSETRTTLALAGHKRLMGALQRLLSVRGIKGEKCMLLAGFTGTNVSVRRSRREVFAITRRHKGLHIGRTFGREWNRQRFRTPYLRNTLWEMGYATDTLETAIAWSKVSKMVHAIESALVSTLADVGERVHAFTHLSHPYPHGSSIYTTYLFRVAPDPGETLRRWQVLKEAASRAIVALGGTISHQHGVGKDHMPYLSHEKGPLGMAAIGDLCNRFDPDGIMNPGKLVP